ncbi:MAG: trigger factor [Acidobacteria bacterium]|nr:trigger factor [Acidobacteriota bacterium]MXZ37675.1 trigger factor [Holophagales bacterium]MYF04265.1 trigger factor [Holophagales bacterium]MYJ25247.1 trigger factor [Holophagales bacterium]
MTVVVSKRDVGVCRQEFEIEVPASEVDAEYLRVARDYRRRARIDGFRKGKAPLDLVRQRFADAIGEDVSERLAPEYWRKASEEDGVHAMLPPSVAPVQAAPGEPLRFTVTVDVEPEVEIGDSRSFELPRPETEPSEAEVEELLEQVRLQRSTWVPVERAAARGDRVRGRIHRAAMPGYIPEAAAEEQPDQDDHRGPATHDIDLELGDERAWPELTDNLTGLSAGQKADFERKETEDDVERQRGYEIEVDEVLERKLPDVDDDWASSLAATIETVDDLRRQLSDQVQAQKVEQAGQQRTDALLDQLRERYPVTLPEAVVEREALQMARSYANNLARQGFDFEQQQLPWEQLMEEIRPQAEKRAHSSFLLDRIARDDGVEATPEDLERALEIMARARNTNRGRLRRELEREGGLEMLRVELRRDRTVQALLAANAPPEEPSGPADEPAAEGDG